MSELSLATFLKILWTVIPFVIFVGILLWAYWPSNRASIEAQGRIPFGTDESKEC